MPGAGKTEASRAGCNASVKKWADKSCTDAAVQRMLANMGSGMGVTYHSGEGWLSPVKKFFRGLLKVN